MAFQAKLARVIGLNEREIAIFRTLRRPEDIQDYITAMPSNAELDGDTCYSVRTAIAQNRCHCIEGAFIAACALMLHGRPALLLDFQAEGDDDHVCALFRAGGRWGAISKSNSIWLRWRDPIYKSLRELAMSCFHEYVIRDTKTLRRISRRPFNIGAYDPACWVTSETDCWDIAEKIDRSPHVALITQAQARRLRKRDAFEAYADTIKEFGNDGKRGVKAMWSG
jgi:hypothetical protein